MRFRPGIYVLIFAVLLGSTAGMAAGRCADVARDDCCCPKDDAETPARMISGRCCAIEQAPAGEELAARLASVDGDSVTPTVVALETNVSAPRQVEPPRTRPPVTPSSLYEKRTSLRL